MTEMRTLDPDLTTIRADELEIGDLVDLEPLVRVFGDEDERRDVAIGVHGACYEYATVASAPEFAGRSTVVFETHDGPWTVPCSLLVHAIKKGQRVVVGGREMEV